MTFKHLKTLIYYHLGIKLVNTRHKRRICPITVQKINGKQVRSNIKRLTDYSLDDLYWEPAYKYPELFL